ncbi:MAG: ABC transporter permease, partial [Phycisphaerales bacterium]
MTLWQDLRFALRTLWKDPGFTAVAVLTLALGIGANTAVFSVLDRLLVRTLPVRDPHRLAMLAQKFQGGRLDYEFNYPLFRDYQRDNSVFSDLCAVAEMPVGLGVDAATERQQALLVSGNYFRMLGVAAAVGRTFAEDEGVEIDDAPVVVLSHGLWSRRFGGDPQAVGRAITVNGKPFTIVGVAPREFFGATRGRASDLYVPFTMYGQLTRAQPGPDHPLQTRFFTWHQILGRLKDGVTHAQAGAAMRTLAEQIHAVTPTNTVTDIVVLPAAGGFAEGVREARLPLHVLCAAAGLVLLIVCANLANLQLVRAAARSRDFAVRAALGASRGRLIRELLTEGLVLSLVGGGLGLLVALWLTGLLERFRLAGSSFELAGGLDGRVLWFAFGVSVLTGVVFGLVPAWRASRPQLAGELKGARIAADGPGGRWSLRDTLVVSQVGISMLVLVGAGLCARSLERLQRTDPGFEPSRVILASFDLGLNDYSEARAEAFLDRLLERVRTLPGVESAGLISNTPLSGGSPGRSIDHVEGYEKGPRERLAAGINTVSLGCFRTLGVPLLRGRDFDATDAPTGPRTVIVDDAFAQRYWPGRDPVGRRVYLAGPGGSEPVEVVGVVGAIRSRRLTDAPRPTMFFPISQDPTGNLTLAVRTGSELAVADPLLREVEKSLDP